MRLTASVLCTVLVAFFTSEVTQALYRQDFCYCQLDETLKAAKTALENGKSYNITLNEIEASEPTEETSRKKRETVEEDSNTHNYALGLPHPRGAKVEFDTKLDIINNGTGVLIEESGATSLCSCIPGSLVRGKICLLNMEFDENYEDPKSEHSKNLTSELLPFLDEQFHLALRSNKGLYVRIFLEKYVKFGEKNIQIVFKVQLNDTFAPDFVIKSALELALRSDHILKYETDINDDINECVSTEDITPVVITDDRLIAGARYIFIAVAGGVLVLLLLVTCFGPKDKFMVMYW